MADAYDKSNVETEILTLHEKLSFPLKNSSVNVTNLIVYWKNP